jgi:ATP-dependent DNA ligase
MPADLLRSLPKTKAGFVEPMDCLPVSKLPEGSQWVWEIKLDGYRAVAVKSGDTVTLYSRNKKILNKRFPYIAEPLRSLPDGTVVDGEIVALDDDGRPVFNLLQNFTSESGRIRYFVFDLLSLWSADSRLGHMAWMRSSSAIIAATTWSTSPAPETALFRRHAGGCSRSCARS